MSIYFLKTAFLGLVLLCSSLLHGQSIPQNANRIDKKGWRQGTWTILFDSAFQRVTNAKDAQYYRIISYREDKPVGIVRDYYRSGAVQWEGQVLNDQPNDINHGTCTWYREDGTKLSKALFKEGVLISVQDFNSKDLETYLSLNDRGLIAYDSGNYTLAATLFQQAGETYRQDSTQLSLTYSTLVYNLGTAHEQNKAWDKALPCYNEAKQIREQLLDESDSIYIDTVIKLATAYNKLKRYEEAESILIKVKKNYEGVDHTGEHLVRALLNLSESYRGQGRYYDAENTASKARSILESRSQGNSSDAFGEYLTEQIAVSYEAKNLKATEEYVDEQVDYFKKTSGGFDSLWYYIRLSESARMYLSIGRANKAEPLLIAIERYAAKDGKNNNFYYSTLYELSRTYCELRSFSKAEYWLKEYIALGEKALGKNNAHYTNQVISLATIYGALGMGDKQQQTLLRILAIRQGSGDTLTTEYARILQDLSVNAFSHRKKEEAQKFMTRAQSIWVKLPKDIHYAGFLDLQFTYYWDRGFYTRSKSIELARGELIKTHYGEDHIQYASHLNSLGFLAYTTGDFRLGESMHLRALSVTKRIYGEEHTYYASTLQGLGLSQWALGKYGEALASLRKSVTIAQSYLYRQFDGLSEKEKEGLFQEVKSHFILYTSLTLHYPDLVGPGAVSDLFDLRLWYKGMLFNAETRVRKSVYEESNDSIRWMYERWRTQRDVLAKAYQLGPEERASKKVNVEGLEDELRQTEQRLSHMSSVFQKATKKYSWQDIQRQLKKGEAAVEIIRFLKPGIMKTVVDSSDVHLPTYRLQALSDTVQYAALVVVPESPTPEVIVIKNGNDLERKLLKHYRNLMASEIDDTLSYDNYWKPVADVLKRKKTKRVYISADGVYNSINVNSLLNPGTGNYTLDELDIHLVTSLMELLEKSEAPPKHIRNAKLFGHPDYLSKGTEYKESQPSVNLPFTADSLTRAWIGSSVATLPGTKDEVNLIGQLMAEKHVKFNLHTDGAASEEELKKVKSPDILHIATHGFFLSDVDQAIKTGFVGFDAVALRKNPLLRSGLLFAGCQQTLQGAYDGKNEDGILTAYEAMNLNLENTSLVVLSACETGLGEVKNGEGVYGLQRAFQTAGAKSVIMSLWKVDDATTQKLMTSFYSFWLKGKTKVEAFKEAQKEIRVIRHHPYYWGAFVLVGD